MPLDTCHVTVYSKPMLKTFADKETQEVFVNDQWRICFRFRDGDAYDVEITDYH